MPTIIFEAIPLKHNERLLGYAINRTMIDYETVTIAYVFTNSEGTVYLETVGSNLQDYVIDYNLYIEFIKAVDGAFDQMQNYNKMRVN